MHGGWARVRGAAGPERLVGSAQVEKEVARGLAGLSLSLMFFSRKELERRKEERVRERICACGQFSRTHKNELDPRKIESEHGREVEFKLI